MHSSRPHFRRKLGAAPHTALHGGHVRPDRPGQTGAGAGVNAHDAGAASGSEVKRPGVARDQEIGFSGEGGELRQPGAPAQIESASRLQVVQKRVDKLAIVPGADGDQAGAEFFDCAAADRGKMLGRPPLGAPPPARVEDHSWRRHARQGVCGPAPLIVSDRHVELHVGCLGAQRTGDALDALRGVKTKPGRVDHVGVEPACSFACVGDAHAHLGLCGRGHERRAQQPLEVDRQIKIAGTQPVIELDCASEAKRIDAAAVALEDDQLVEVRVALEQILKCLADNPRQMSRRPASTQGREDRQRVHDVAQRTRLDNANSSGLEPGKPVRCAAHEQHEESLPRGCAAPRSRVGPRAV